ncbi:MAG: hypothetical protein QG603_743 [Patescibacteria group bacterium]|nr:hypothetical protein [Patescibacteria group bacterium]MDQ5970966.1 hypothetical protein [Patescibacteria group bacterium]
MAKDIKKEWEDYCTQEIAILRPLLVTLGFELDEEQVHIGGERYAFSEKKLVLIGRRLADSLRVIIKVSGDDKGITEIKHERQSRQMLEKINFAYHVFFTPAEILYQEHNGRVIFITKYIEQDCQFLERPLIEQFFLALKGLEVQEGVQVTTYEHAHEVSKYFGIWTATDYLQYFAQYQQEVAQKLPGQADLLALYEKAGAFLKNNIKIIDLYGGFLTHWDFVPHNIRIHDGDIYLLDHSSLRFGSKHESWARFINFMSMHHTELEKALLFYVKENRPASEYLSLQAMRVYRLVEIIWHYANTVSKAEGDLLVLNNLRIKFYTQLLTAVLADQSLDQSVVTAYIAQRDTLRSEAEKIRQKNLH